MAVTDFEGDISKLSVKNIPACFSGQSTEKISFWFSIDKSP
jgi:hypothetical protein